MVHALGPACRRCGQDRLGVHERGLHRRDPHPDGAGLTHRAVVGTAQDADTARCTAARIPG